MEKVQNVVKSAKEFGEKDQHGNQGYWIEFEDGSKGSFRTPNNDLFIPGNPATYAIKEMRSSEKAGNYAILQRYKEPYEPGKKVEKSSKNSEKFMCLSYAKDIYIAFWDNKSSTSMVPNPTEITAYAEILYSETINGKEEKKEEETNELPF